MTVMYNKLLSRHRRRAVSEPTAEDRCSGRSTSLALKIIAKAIDGRQHYPYDQQWVEVKDHHETESANVNLFTVVKNIVVRLKLQHFEFNASNLSVRCNYKTDNPWEIE